MTTFFYSMQIVSAVLSVFLILLHSPKGDGMASIGAASQLFASQKSTENGFSPTDAEDRDNPQSTWRWCC